ncbi:hypothetical protein, partial [Xenorhabdus bovienii]|uniref:hypothetical protein n=1 Tax=Xenorhabdus bovienii TaxID=40576 RepID=UPI0023B348AD
FSPYPNCDQRKRENECRLTIYRQPFYKLKQICQPSIMNTQNTFENGRRQVARECQQGEINEVHPLQ